jgi:GNAT superfamily N-acetyltransferase
MRTELALKVAQAIVRVRALTRAVTDSSRTTFHRIERAELEEVGDFRVRHYASCANRYLLGQLDERGLDELDPRGFVYVARNGGRIVATIRAVPAPFELDKYVRRGELQGAVGAELHRYVEVSRMLVAPELAGKGIGSAMAGFGGIDLLLNTSYRGYFAYIRESGARNFELPGHRIFTFRIPDRGDHRYSVISGAIALDTLWRAIGRARAAANRPKVAREVAREETC